MSRASGGRELIDLRREHEVVARQARGGVGGELERSTAPTQLDLGVMALRLGDQRRPRDEAERVAEVRKRELAAKGAVSVALPLRNLGRQRCRLLLRKRGRARRADLTVRVRELTHSQKLRTGRREAQGTIGRCPTACTSPTP